MLKIFINNGYNNAPPTIKIIIKDTTYTLERTELEEYITKAITERGYTTSKTPQQRIPRIHLEF